MILTVLYKIIKEEDLFFPLIFFLHTKALIVHQDKLAALQPCLWIIFGLPLITDLDSFHRSVGADKSWLVIFHQSVPLWSEPAGGAVAPPALSACLTALTGRCRCEALLSRISMSASREERRIWSQGPVHSLKKKKTSFPQLSNSDALTGKWELSAGSFISETLTVH